MHKGEKLRHSRLVNELFKSGDSVYEFPLRATWRLLSAEELEGSFRNEVPERVDRLQMLITVPKKKRRHAVDRVLMRRRIRESYRLHRGELKRLAESLPECGTLSLAFVYLSDQNLPYDFIEKRMKRVLAKIEKRVLARCGKE